MDTQFRPEKDILISHRENPVQGYMSPEHQQTAPHFHYQYELLLCVEGTAEFVIAGQAYSLTPGSMLFMSNMETHWIQSYSKGYERYTLRFSNDIVELYLRNPLLLSVFKQRPKSFSHYYQCDNREFARYLKLIRLMEQEYRQLQPYWEQMIAAKLLTILVSMYRRHPDYFPGSQNTENQNLIFNVQNYIELNLGEDLSLDAVAAKFFISKYHLSHCFTQVTGYSFKEFIIIGRISKAKDLLLSTKDEVSAIGQAVGFRNASNFIRTFKTRERVSPLQYRNQARKPG